MARARTLHVLGGGQWQLPTIRLGKSLGYRVLVSDMYVDRPGYAIADAHAVVDITDAEATLALAREHRVDGIVCDTTDVGVPTMAYVADALGLPGIGYETAQNFTNKHRMRQITSAAGVPNPPFCWVTSRDAARRAARDLGFPCVLKPADNQSSRGVHVLRDPSAFDAAYDDAVRATRAGGLIVEGFLDGIEVTVESFCVEGAVHVIGVSDKDHFAHRPEVANRLTYPAALPDTTLARIQEVNAQVVRALGMRTGITHAEYMVVNGDVLLVEIAARGAGSFVYSHIVPYLADAPVPRRYLEYLMGGAATFAGCRRDRAANLAFFAFEAGTVESIEGVDAARAIPGVQEILLEFVVGDRLAPPHDDRSRPGLVVVFGETRGEVLQRTGEVFAAVRVRVR